MNHQIWMEGSTHTDRSQTAKGLVSFDLSQSSGATFFFSVDFQRTKKQQALWDHWEFNGGFGRFFFPNERRTLVESEVLYIFCIYIYIYIYIYIFMYIYNIYAHGQFIWEFCILHWHWYFFGVCLWRSCGSRLEMLSCFFGNEQSKRREPFRAARPLAKRFRFLVWTKHVKNRKPQPSKHTNHFATLPETNIAPEFQTPGKGDSYWKPPFSGAMLVSGRVKIREFLVWQVFLNARSMCLRTPHGFNPSCPKVGLLVREPGISGHLWWFHRWKRLGTWNYY